MAIPACKYSFQEDEPVLVGGNDDAKYVVVFDPLDGSSNIDASIPTGELFMCLSLTWLLLLCCCFCSIFLTGCRSSPPAYSADSAKTVRCVGRARLESFSGIFQHQNHCKAGFLCDYTGEASLTTQQ